MGIASALALPLLDFALPPRCAGCGSIVAEPDRFCSICWRQLDFLPRQGCTRCGLPMAQAGLTCAPCLASPPDHDGVRAATAYGAIARDVALRLKHGRRPALARTMAAAMERLLDPDEAALLAPVPLHRWRLWARGFNQSALIAAALAQRTGLAVDRALLERVKRTPMLRGLGAAERAATVRGAIRCRADRAVIDDRHILLVDDVYTSGATASACARALKKAGARRVTVLVWARVLRADDW